MSLKVPTAPTAKPHNGVRGGAGSTTSGSNGRANLSLENKDGSVTSRSAAAAGVAVQKAAADIAPQHPYLTAAQISRANAAFLNYCEGQGMSSGGAGATMMMNAKGVQAFLNDIGVVKTESEAKDIIFTLNQSAATQQRNKEAALALAASTAPEAAGGANTTIHQEGGDGRFLPNNNGSPAPASLGDAAVSKGQSLGFPLFLELMTTTFPQDYASRDGELQRAFSVMDVNGDSVITESDVRSLVQAIMVENPTNTSIQALAAMTKEQLSAAIAEADFDGDGHVTLDDFIKILTTA